MKKPTSKELIITFLKHYSTEDPEFKSEFFDSEIIINGKSLGSLGSYDGTSDPCSYFDGFVDAIKYLDKNKKLKLDLLQIEYDHVADSDEQIY